MKITFLGATKQVTGSNFLVEAAGKKFLVDCGMFQGRGDTEAQNYKEFAYNPAEIDFMLLTHAHIDHSGRIPKLYKEGFKGQIFAHKATCDLCNIMLQDSGHIQEMESVWKNKKRQRKGEEPLEPLYTVQDAVDTLELFTPVQYDELIEIDTNIHVRFNDAGHMLGSSIIEIWENVDGKETKAVFTGDLGNNDIPLLGEPTMIDDADFLVMESTYGSRLHNRNEEKAEIFLDIVSRTLDNKGTVVIPSFAVGRTQEILYELNKLKENRTDEKFRNQYATLMKAPVYVDSPLAISATQIFRENMDIFDEETKSRISMGDNPLEFPGLRFAQTADESKSLNENPEPAIIISASGMCEVGRIKHHLKHHLWQPNSTVLFVGYQAPGTLGYSIVNGAEAVKIFGEEINVNANVEYIEGYSGHADQEWLMNFIYSFIKKPKHIFLVHGEEESQEILRNKIIDEVGINVTVPDWGETYDLSDEVTLTNKIPYDKPLNYRDEVMRRLQQIKLEMIEMENYIKQDVNDKNLKEQDMFRINEKMKELEKKILNVVEG